jgi:hypothetical protein
MLNTIVKEVNLNNIKYIYLDNILTWYEAEVHEEVALSFIDGSYLKDIVH